jgi:hypothetical protein
MTSPFSDDFLEALGAWQRGWREDPARRQVLAAALKAQIGGLPSHSRKAPAVCFRKRFLYRGDFAHIFLVEAGLDEGPTSWTQDPRFAHKFHGFHRADAVTAAIFMCEPRDDQVLVNVAALWDDATFRKATDDYTERGGSNADALNNFKASQGEVIVHAPLRWHDIVGLTGIAPAFDDFADQVGIVEAARPEILRALKDAEVYPGEPRWVWGRNAQADALSARNQVVDKINALLDDTGKVRPSVDI